MLLSICGCKKGDTVISEVIYDGTSSQENTDASNDDTSGDEETTSDDDKDQDDADDSEESDDDNSTADDDDQADDKKEEIIIDYNTVVDVDICDDIVRAYLDATDPTRQYVFLSQYDTMVLDYQNLNLTWKPDGSTNYYLHIAEKADFSDAHVSKITGTYDNGNMVSSKTLAVCIPGKTYYWKVVGSFDDSPRGGGRIRINNAPTRWIKLDGVSNVRDMGGWPTTSGKTVKYGKIYRGSKLDDITQIGIDTIKYLGIKTDIDIRSTASWDSHGAVPSTGLNYYFIDTNVHYDYVLGGGDSEKEIKENYPKIFELLADESNYPIYLHCNYGNDRTGSMAFILNGLLGVTYEDLTRDYEITSYAYAHDRRWRGNGTGGTFAPDDLIQNNISNSNVDGRWGMMNKAFMESEYCTDGKLSTAIEKFLLARGVQQEHIDAYKKIMLG